MDEIDLLLIKELQKNADRTVYQLAKQLGLNKSTVYSRINKLKKDKIIKRYQAIVDYDEIGLPICAIMLVSHKKTSLKDTLGTLIQDPAVEEIRPVTGSYDLIIKARFKDMTAVSDFIFKKIGKPNISNIIVNTETLISLGTYKEYFETCHPVK
ncbi:MAG: Lrp/AsnC family transcriptional regulator [Nanoarchaeota archaeon]|nr:Lrp/AsnC family transcriptional regulator [Nanoarchaeota archaeon]MBU1321627.1 Lrp/AsnC family transcriptional regulator [Nanoarchaeota archaeon]MBU1597411.1 Lrp/AsnC family transcriptional regulator [Nanoarchaeota archaeon]MBU2440926.1 Lrp/AsnC family transcriptional regulator [Nanoarchaeota archaeon]